MNSQAFPKSQDRHSQSQHPRNRHPSAFSWLKSVSRLFPFSLDIFFVKTNSTHSFGPGIFNYWLIGVQSQWHITRMSEPALNLNWLLVPHNISQVKKLLLPLADDSVPLLQFSEFSLCLHCVIHFVMKHLRTHRDMKSELHRSKVIHLCAYVGYVSALFCACVFSLTTVEIHTSC